MFSYNHWQANHVAKHNELCHMKLVIVIVIAAYCTMNRAQYKICGTFFQIKPVIQ